LNDEIFDALRTLATGASQVKSSTVLNRTPQLQVQQRAGLRLQRLRLVRQGVNFLFNFLAISDELID
jgi:hypothetical protein